MSKPYNMDRYPPLIGVLRFKDDHYEVDFNGGFIAPNCQYMRKEMYDDVLAQFTFFFHCIDNGAVTGMDVVMSEARAFLKDVNCPPSSTGRKSDGS